MTLPPHRRTSADFAGLRALRPQHFGLDGCLCGARRYAEPGADSRWEDFWGKLSQSLDYGALTCQLRTDFDGCVKILNELVRQKPVYLLNSVNPYRIEGQKTAAIELLEQLEWEAPDHIIVAGGNLGNSSAIGKALLEMLELKLISRLPKLSIIQAEGANPFYRCVHEFGGSKLVPMTPILWRPRFALAIRHRGRKLCGCCEQPAARSSR